MVQRPRSLFYVFFGSIVLSVLLLATIFFIKSSGVKSVHAQASITVTSLTDNGTGGCTLREAINVANGGPVGTTGCTAGSNTTEFGLDGTITLASALPTISSTIIIDATGHTIILNGNTSYRAFNVGAAGNLTITNLTIQNGLPVSGNGGGLYNGGILTVNNCTFVGNSTTGTNSGGAIRNAGTAIVNYSTFANNSTSSTGGSGGAIRNSGQLIVNHSTFSGNSTNTNGGAIRHDGTGSLTVTSSTFYDNTATNEGSSIYGYGGTSLKTFSSTRLVLPSTIAMALPG